VAAMSRFLLATVVTAALVCAVPAHASNTDAPGALKKDDPAASNPAQQVATKPGPPQAVPHVQQHAHAAPTHAATPLNNGQAKKAASTGTATGTNNGHGTGVRTRTGRTGAVSGDGARRSGAAARHRSRTTHSRSTALPNASHHATPAYRAPSHRSTLPATASPRARAARHHGKLAHAKPEPTTTVAAPLLTIARDADRVIQVIPGVVVLALVVLTALVFLLILRSLAMERRRAKALASSYGTTVEALATAIEAKDHTTGGHIERVRRLGLLLAGEIVPGEAGDLQMAYGFLLHDIGKLAVPDAILRAPGRLTDDEWGLMRRHPEEGARMLERIPFLDRALDVVRYHHERWDGGGYPHGLTGEEIPLWARIFAVVDALDAITAERPYRPARSYEDALDEIRRHAGTQFDPAVVAALERLDPALVEPLLEPAQQLGPEIPGAPALAPLVAA
jgi:HD-GYP domain-containing protein (c-di-GMP phosphodiesterase class II)